MRYDDWDVILFPRDSHVPIQEFKTACFVSQADYGRPLPTLTCFISSLPPATPFRISIHSWRTVLKASALLDSQRKGNQKIVFVVQVIIGETRVFHGYFELASKWPQEITHEKRPLASNDLPSSQRRRPLEFPPFHSLTLLNHTWDARDTYGRIRVILSEQLINKSLSPGSLDLGTANELVCFSFQHAPKDILQQAGISWPIQNPLYFPDTFTRNNQHPRTGLTAPWIPRAPSFAEEMSIQTPPSQNAQPIFGRPHEAEFKRHPNAHLPRIPPFPKQSAGSTGHGCHASMWDDAFASLGNGADNFSMDHWSTKRKTSAFYDYSTPSYISTSHPPASVPPCMGNTPHHRRNKSDEWNGHPTNQEKQVVVTLRDDQLGQIIHALSPPKRNLEISQTPSSLYHDNSQKASHDCFPSKAMAASRINHPSSAFPARKPSYSDSNSVLRNISNKLSSQKHYSQDQNKDATSTIHRPYISARNEDTNPSQLRLRTPSPRLNITPTPDVLVHRQPTVVSDLSMKDWPSVHSSICRMDRNEESLSTAKLSRLSSAHGSSGINAKSQKENQTSNSPKSLDQAVQHDKNPPQAANLESRAVQGFISRGPKPFLYHDRRNIPNLVEIIDIDAIDPELDMNAAPDTNKPSPFKPSHKSNASLSSIDSTVRLERQLFSALGEELGSFDHHIETTGIGPELAQALGGATSHSELSGSALLDPTTSDFEPPAKRKRQGTLGGDRGGSPLSKKEKAELAEAQEQKSGLARGE